MHVQKSKHYVCIHTSMLTPIKTFSFIHTYHTACHRRMRMYIYIPTYIHAYIPGAMRSCIHTLPHTSQAQCARVRMTSQASFLQHGLAQRCPETGIPLCVVNSKAPGETICFSMFVVNAHLYHISCYMRSQAGAWRLDLHLFSLEAIVSEYC